MDTAGTLHPMDRNNDDPVAALRWLMDPDRGYENLTVRMRLFNGEYQVVDTSPDLTDNLGVLATTMDDGGYTAMLIAALINAAPTLLADRDIPS